MALVAASCCFLVVSLASASEVFDSDQPEEVSPGDDVTLQCQAPRDAAIILLDWNRPDLKSHGYVFFYRNKRWYENYQHPSFRGRVELRDPEMKDGDVSVILKNVTVNDSGTYECRVITIARNETTPSETQRLIDLMVIGSVGKTWAGGNEDGGSMGGVVVGLSVIVVLVVVVVVVSCVTFKQQGLKCNHSYKRPPGGEMNPQQI